MYSALQTAIVAAREDEALTHGQVLYGLIKPTKDMEQIESTAAMVNVIPKQRYVILIHINVTQILIKTTQSTPVD